VGAVADHHGGVQERHLATHAAQAGALEILPHSLVDDAVADEAEEGVEEHHAREQQAQQLGVLRCGQHGQDPHDAHQGERHHRQPEEGSQITESEDVILEGEGCLDGDEQDEQVDHGHARYGTH